MVAGNPGHVVAPGSPAFDLHTLGWRAFQDLCAAVVRTVWGQSAQAFADSNDGGRDGAFYGIWHDPPASRGGAGLSAARSSCSASTPKGRAARFPIVIWRTSSPRSRHWSQGGLCRSYVLMTNARVTGNSEAEIRGRLLDAGVEHPLVLGGQWVCDTIAAHREAAPVRSACLRAGRPVADTRRARLRQASVLMEAARDQVATFVITEPYRKSSPGPAGPRIRAAPGRAGSGQVGHRPDARARGRGQLGLPDGQGPDRQRGLAHWNPHEPGQFFWVDDAFGAVRHEEQLTQDWARSMPHVKAAIGKGARVVLTSRSYIYQEARPLLKEYAYPRLREQTGDRGRRGPHASTSVGRSFTTTSPKATSPRRPERR